MNIEISPDAHADLPGLQVLASAWPDRLTTDGTPVAFQAGRETAGFSLSHQPSGFHVLYSRPCDAYRALGLLLTEESPPGHLAQDCAHESVGVLWDLSRNGVLRPEAWEKLFLKFALLGINAAYLYMEDVYAIPGEPFFGYGRGAYSCEELQQIDRSGRMLGIEVIPCIQTLGHAEQILQWPPYQDCLDAPGVMMAGEESSRRLVGKMLDAVAEAFQTRTVHIGMDEAYGAGRGRSLTKHGYRPLFDVLTGHLQMVTNLCRERGLRPMMWSDMFFRIGSAKHDYYDREAVIPDEVAGRIPPDVDLVYWDYHHADSAFYEEWIGRHRKMGKEPVFAAGAWTAGRFWAYAPGWKESLDAGMRAARNQKLGRVLLTIWGDDGAEFHPASALPAIQYFAEWAYAGPPSESALDKTFTLIAPKAVRQDYLKASQLDEVPAVRGVPECQVNYSKWILWHDPILGFLNAHLPPDLPTHYRNLARALSHPAADEPVEFAARVARAVAAKAELHGQARTAWLASDGREIRRLHHEVLPECLCAVRELWQAHREVWHAWNKPFGWEVLEGRYAGCIARLESLGRLLEECLRNPQLRVPEWESAPLPLNKPPLEGGFSFGRSTTPSACR